MFRWNEDMIRFLRDASEHSDYHHLLAEYLAKRLPMCVMRAVGWGTSACSWPPTADK